LNAKSDLPQGTLDLLLLKVVALGPVHGYAIAQRLEQVSRHVVQVPQGSLYPALHRLENGGLLASDWKETETGREAKFYRLTRKGRAQLETEAASWERLTEAVALILKLSKGGAELTGGDAFWAAERWKSNWIRKCAFIWSNMPTN
jgi:PadR family transcriptional regulator PadR